MALREEYLLPQIEHSYGFSPASYFHTKDAMLNQYDIDLSGSFKLNYVGVDAALDCI